MMSHLIDPSHLATAFGYLVIGGVLLELAFRLWNTHPVNRPFLFNGLLTERGVARLLKLWPLVFLFGAFILSCAIDHALDYIFDGHRGHFPVLEAAAVAEAVITWVTAIVLVFVRVRWSSWTA